jgi:hypothetical protein
MKEVTLITRTSHTIARKSGELVTFTKNVPQYFADDDEIISSIARLKQKDGTMFQVSSDIKSIKLPKDWVQLPKRELAAILDSLGRNKKTLLNHENYVDAVKQAIKANLISVASDVPVGEGNMKTLLRENQDLQKRVAKLEKENGAQKKAFVDTIAELRKEFDDKLLELEKAKK